MKTYFYIDELSYDELSIKDHDGKEYGRMNMTPDAARLAVEAMNHIKTAADVINTIERAAKVYGNQPDSPEYKYSERGFNEAADIVDRFSPSDVECQSDADFYTDMAVARIKGLADTLQSLVSPYDPDSPRYEKDTPIELTNDEILFIAWVLNEAAEIIEQ